MTDIDRRSALKMLAGASAMVSSVSSSFASPTMKRPPEKPNVLFLMVDQQRFDTIAGLGNQIVYTPNLDRLVRRGITFTNAYSPCPVCIPARYCIRTGCLPPTTAIFSMERQHPAPNQAPTMTGRCGPYLPQTMKNLGYRTFGIGKFHTIPWDEQLGYDVQLHSEPSYGTADQRKRDSYASWIATQHPEFNFIEQLMGERTEMYYMPQVSPLPALLTVEGWAATQAVNQIGQRNGQPYFGFVSFIGPHPPFSPPIPFNRLYDPEKMPPPILGDLKTDFMDEQIPFMNYEVWAEDVDPVRTRSLKARYYGEITYIDFCIGRILDAVEQRGDADNTLICFFSDHGDLLGDHHGWQKECFFEASCHVPFLVSWPARIPASQHRNDLVCLTDLFGIATGAAGRQEIRQGSDILRLGTGAAKERQSLVCYYGDPGTPRFKIMVRSEQWKYIYMADGGRQQLFNLRDDPNELVNLAELRRDVAKHLSRIAVAACQSPEMKSVLMGNTLRQFPFQARPMRRIYQFDRSRGITGFPDKPQDTLKHKSL